MNRGIKAICLLLICFICAGCGSGEGVQTTKELETGFVPARAGMYDSADTAVIKQIRKSEKTITFFNLVREKSYTLTYDGTTKLFDKYGSAVSMEQIEEGDIVDITFLKEKKTLASLQKSDAGFVLEEVTNFSINEKTKEITVGGNTYRYPEELLIFSKGEQVEIMDINAVDSLCIQGIDHTVYSVSIQEGHGYLRLKNDEYFWGGWIEVGQEIIRPIEEDMLLVVPEGKYDVLLTADGVSATKKVSIKRDKETELDVGNLKKEDLRKYGNLIFAVTPDTASIYIDGEPVDITAPVKVEYGIHQVMAKAEEYQTVIQYIKVGQENATIQITMENDTGESVSANTTTTSTETDATSTNGSKITISAPTGAEVYVDGSYIGIVPVSFKKTTGVHVITLRQTGYETKSYTINVQDLTDDESMSFSALVKEEEESKDNDDEDEDDEDKEDEEKDSSEEDEKDSSEEDEKDSSDEEEDDKSVSQNG